jgi:amino acid permease
MSYFKESKSFFYSTAAMVGTMVGVGIFGIPFSFTKAGFIIGFLLLILIGFLTLLINYVFGEVVLRTQQRHQIVGYTELYLGPKWKSVIFFATVLSSYAAMLAYIIISGDFLSNILSTFFYVSNTVYSYLFAVIMSLLLLLELKRVSIIELILTFFFIFVVLLIFTFGLDKINFNNLKTINFEFWFLPYGVLLFAFSGMSSVPIQREILRGNEVKLKKSILWSVLLVGFLYFIFAFIVVGISGDATSPDAISGLFDFLGEKIIIISSIFGLLAISTSFLMLGVSLDEVFRWDYGMKKFLSWFFTILPPLGLFFSGFRNFIDVINLAGSLAVGLIMIVVIFIFMAAKAKGDRIPEYNLDIPKGFIYLMLVFFIIGIVYTLFIK